MTRTVIPPALPEKPATLSVERVMAVAAGVLYRGWTVDFDKWFASPGSVLMTPAVDVPFYFQTEFGGRRNAHYGRFLRLEPNRLIELSWVTGAGGTEGAETVVTVELTPSDERTTVRLTHSGLPNEQARSAHNQAWPLVLAQMEHVFSTAARLWHRKSNYGTPVSKPGRLDGRAALR
jgi:uncharacterized protein YndB with AHSA1/START domain